MFCASLVLGIHLATYHFNREEKYQNFNPGVSIECNNYQFGSYYNSHKKTSVYGAYNIKRLVGPIDLSLGLVTGYKMPLTPLVVPSVKLGDVRISLLIPTSMNSGGLHFSKEF